MMGQSIALNYIRWIDRHKYVVIAVSVVVAIIAGWLASALPIRSEFSNLLPPDRQSVRDLNELKDRIRTFGTVFVVIEGSTPQRTAQASDHIRPLLRQIDPDLISKVVDGDAETRAYFWNHRFLFVSVADLRETVAALRERIHKAKLAANPLFIDLSDEEDADDASLGQTKSKELIARLDSAEANYKGDGSYLSPDGLVKLFVLRTTTPTTDFERSKKVVRSLDGIAQQVEKAVSGVEVGLTGDVVSTYFENESIMRGIALASVITGVLIIVLLLVYFRAPLAVLASLWSLLVAIVITFALTYLLVGHLNVMSSFLIAIVAGNGINSGLILLARYFEELRTGKEGQHALASALGGAARGTLTAAISAGVAYGALAVTEFRGFRHFGIIGSIGMVTSWLTAFSVLPAGLCVLRSWGRISPRKAPILDRVLVFLCPKTPRVALSIGFLVCIGAAVLTVRFVLSDPFETDWRNLSSASAEIDATRILDERMRQSVGSEFGAGLTSRFVVGVNDRELVAPVVKALQEAPKSLLTSVMSIDDLLPSAQPEKLALLDELRDLINEVDKENLDEDDLRTVERIRPPEGLDSIVFEDIPQELSWPFVEKDGSVGKLILVGGAERFKSWSVDDRIELAEGVRGLDLPDETLLGGQSFVIADIIASMETDGPKASGVAVLGAVLAVFLLVGVGRYGVVTLVAGFVGILGMIAMCYLAGLKVNFLDLVALPITIGIGIDYSVNLAVRQRQRQRQGASISELLGTTGGAVLLCSLTTMIGYGSLLLSENAGVRSFGLAAMLGELACLGAAVLLVPGLLLWRGQRRH